MYPKLEKDSLVSNFIQDSLFEKVFDLYLSWNVIKHTMKLSERKKNSILLFLIFFNALFCNYAYFPNLYDFIKLFKFKFWDSFYICIEF